MKGDFSRIAHDRRKHYSRVLQQQGRVALDADHNEGAEIHHHLDRVTRRDVIGASGVPKKNGAFKLEPTPDNKDLFISEGRFYLDGLVVEVDATPVPVTAVQNEAQAVRVPRWEVDGQGYATDQWVELTAQGQPEGRMRVSGIDANARKVTLAGNVAPYLQAPGGAWMRRLPTLRTQADAPDVATLQLTSGTPLLLYLEVHERHLTEIEDPTLREVALGGPDTTTRVKTVWRLLAQNAGTAEDCASPVAGWPPQPGKGRLTTTATATPKSDDPCVLPPEGGYRGVENRLYRVEIQKGGDVGTATYKWSRDNGALAYAVESFLPADGSSQVTSVKLRSLGRDRTLGLREGDWVEITDDQDDLAGNVGLLATVEKVDLAERTVRLSADVATYKSRDRRAKLRRWDMKGAAVTANGIAIDGSTDELEDGVTVDFTGSAYKPGDWWSFAARVATGDVERLDSRAAFNEPRKHARIGLLTWELDPATGQTAPKIQDCRKPFDPLTEPCGCCCDVTVGDGVESFGDHTDLQKALDSIQHEGTVCILKGTHKWKKTVTAKGGPLVIRSCGKAARIVGPGGKPTLVVEESAVVTLEGLHVEAQSAATPVVVVRQSDDVKVLDCVLVNGEPGKSTQGIALEARAVDRLLVKGCDLQGKPALVLGASKADVEDNRLTGGGVTLLDDCDDVILAHNHIGPGDGDGVRLGGDPPDEKPGEAKAARMSGITLRDNRISGMGGNGVATRDPEDEEDKPPQVPYFLMADNDVVGCVKDEPTRTGKRGEAVGGVVLRGLERATIHGNRVVRNGFNTTRAVGILAQGVGITVTDNLVEANGGVAEEADGSAYDISFEDEEPNEMKGPRRTVDGVTFDVSDHDGSPAESTRVDSMGTDYQGLDCGFETIVTFPSPATGLTIKIATFSSQVRIHAEGPSGQSEDHTTTKAGEPEEISFTIPVERLVIDAPQDETLLMALESEGDVQPRPFQAGIVVLGPDSVAQEDDEAEDAKTDESATAAPAAAPPAAPAEAQPMEAEKMDSDGMAAREMDERERRKLEMMRDLKKKAGAEDWKTGTDVVVHDNVVATPRGQSLLVLVAGGSVSVQDNVLETRGVALHGEESLDKIGGVVVVNFPYRLWGGEFQSRPQTSYAKVSRSSYTSDRMAYGNQRVGWYDLSDRRVLFRGNQVSLKDRVTTGDRSLAAMSSLDDVIVEGNQFRHDLGEQQVSVAVRAFAVTLQARGNRFFELPLQADFSLHATGFSGIVAHNVAMHCIQVDGGLVKEQNVVQTRNDDDCKALEDQG